MHAVSVDRCQFSVGLQVDAFRDVTSRPWQSSHTSHRRVVQANCGSGSAGENCGAALKFNGVASPTRAAPRAHLKGRIERRRQRFLTSVSHQRRCEIARTKLSRIYILRCAADPFIIFFLEHHHYSCTAGPNRIATSCLLRDGNRARS